MAIFIVILAALAIITMVTIKIVHGCYARRKAWGFRYLNNEYLYRGGSTKWFYIRRLILFSCAVLAVFWYIAFRYIPLFNDGIEKGWLNGVGKHAGDASQVNYNKGWSMVLFLDLCTLFGLVSPLVIIFDRKDSWSLAFANLGLLGAIMTFFASYVIYDLPWSFEYLLFGSWTSFTDLPVSFMIHMWMLLFSLYTLLWRRNWVIMDWAKLCALSFGYLFYVLIITQSMGITSHATGLAYHDYVSITNTYHSPYADVIAIFGLPSDQWILAAFGLWSVFAVILVVIFPALHKIVHKYTDVVHDNDYAKIHEEHCAKNSFVRWVAAHNINK